MRRIAALLICIFLFALPVSAANTAVSVRTTAVVTENSACQVTIDVDIRLDEPARGLKFPLGKNIHSVTLNGAAASVSESGGITSVNLGHLDGKTGLYSCTIRYTVNSVVAAENGKQIITVPLIHGFPYPVEDISFTVTMPREFDTVPSFYSGYHGQDIERQMTTSVRGSVITGRVNQQLKDSETLYLKLTAPAGMFPASQTFGGTLSFDASAMTFCACLALVCWLLTMRFFPRISARQTTAPEGCCAGLTGRFLVHRNTDLPAMVLQWAQLGYLIIHLDHNGRVFLHRKMDMGNERSGFEQRCFKELFGSRMMLDATGTRFHNAWNRICAMGRKQPGSSGSPVGSGRLFRLLSNLLGLFAGIAMGDSVSTNHTWRLVTMGVLGIVCLVLCRFIFDGMDCLHLYGKASVKLALAATALLMITAVVCNCPGYGLGAILCNMLAGLLAAYGGRRNDNAARIFSEILGLRRHMRKAKPDEVRRILASNRNYYFELAPYALVLGVDKTFAEKFGKDRLPACTWLVCKNTKRTAPEWYLQLRQVYAAMTRDRKPTLAERIFGK